MTRDDRPAGDFENPQGQSSTRMYVTAIELSRVKTLTSVTKNKVSRFE